MAIGLFAALAAYPIYEMLFGQGHIGGPVVPAGLLQSTRADLFGAIIPTSNQLLKIPAITSIGNQFVGGNLSENGTYIGIPLLILLLMIVLRQRRNATIVAFASAGCVAWVLSLGAHLSIGGWSSPIPLPGDLLTHLPLLDNTIPARYGLYVILFASMLVGIGVERMKFDSVLRDAGEVASRSALSVGQTDVLAENNRSSSPSMSPARARVGRVGPWGNYAGRSQLPAVDLERSNKAVRTRGIVAVSLIPSVPFVSQAVPWPTSFQKLSTGLSQKAQLCSQSLSRTRPTQRLWLGRL